MSFKDWLEQLIGPKAATPTYPARDAMPVEKARERVASDFDALIREAETWWQRNPPKELIKEENPFERFARETLDKKEKEPPPVHAQRSPTGVGKTKIGAKEIAAYRSARREAGDNGPLARRSLGYFGPTHRLNDKTAEEFREIGLTAQVYRGRFALDPNVPGNGEQPESEQVLMCLAPERVKKAMSLYQSISSSCCINERKGLECEFYGQCSFQRQLRGPRPAVWLAAHEMLYYDQEALAELGFIIVDETYWQDGITGIEDARAALTLDEIAIVGVDDPHLALLREKLVKILSEHPLGGLRRDHFLVPTTFHGRPAISIRMHDDNCTDAL
jgi:hypothetical protein